jgi:UDP-N-acetylmuramoylalanine--D-glutamate ligase
MVAITGSNGKTTTTALTGKIIEAGGYHTLVGGNIGVPAISLVDQARRDTIAVLEVSSFQLETIQSYRPHVAVVLNVTPDHLDRHRTFAAYRSAKARIFENQQPDDFAILNADDPTCVGLAQGLKARTLWFSRQSEVDSGAFLSNGSIIFRHAGIETEIMQMNEIALKGLHNVENVLAAISVGMVMGCDPAEVRKTVGEFRAVEHRLEYVANIDGVEFYNDSKATNVDATIKAIESFPGSIHLILGGKDKGSDYSVLNGLISERVKAIYTIGAAASKIESQIKTDIAIVQSGTLESAVKLAANTAKPGDIVLLAPACASFDQFENYEHRGRVFKELVRNLQLRSQLS